MLADKDAIYTDDSNKRLSAVSSLTNLYGSDSPTLDRLLAFERNGLELGFLNDYIKVDPEARTAKVAALVHSGANGGDFQGFAYAIWKL